MHIVYQLYLYQATNDVHMDVKRCIKCNSKVRDSKWLFHSTNDNLGVRKTMHIKLFSLTITFPLVNWMYVNVL